MSYPVIFHVRINCADILPRPVIPRKFCIARVLLADIVAGVAIDLVISLNMKVYICESFTDLNG